ncbi:mRNA-binding ribosome synthesis protein nop7 [Agyrium rufum]|nr:mRNA-binding ribosome synthesis protein nop7 [Agyrium rufum]
MGKIKRKGIYPREPRNRKKASKSSTASTTFYYTKDIQYLLHEPLLNKFREHKALSKKIARSLGRNEAGDAARLEKNGMTKLSLDHIIKERYPTFVDALRDLDDALSLLFLFANLPSTSTVPPKTIALCRRLCLEFEHYIISANALRKSFLSIKGIYYQATIQGQDILWLVPYNFVQRVTGDVDFRIMGTFVEFYTTLLGFVNYRLYTSIGLVYPPKFNSKSDEQGGELNAITLEGRGVRENGHSAIAERKTDVEVNGVKDYGLDSTIQQRVDALTTEVSTEDAAEPEEQNEAADETTTIDTFPTPAPDADVLLQPQISSSEASTLFAPFTFFISRETPRQPLEFLLRSFGCKRIGWDAVLGDGAYTNNDRDTSITHQVVDRPSLPMSAGVVQEPPTNGESSDSNGNTNARSRIVGRSYVQPQWVWDCINAGKLMRADLYAPGATLPPHLSPWIKPKDGEYDPTRGLEEQEKEGESLEDDSEVEEVLVDAENGLKGEELPEKEESDSSSDEATLKKLSSIDVSEGIDDHGMTVADDDQDEDEMDDVNTLNKKSKVASDTSFDGFSPSPEPETQADQSLYENELLAEAQGVKPAPLKGILKKQSTAKRDIEKRKKEEKEEFERRKGMMSRKKRKVLERVMHARGDEDETARKLREKKRKLDKSTSGIAQTA